METLWQARGPALTARDSQGNSVGRRGRGGAGGCCRRRLAPNGSARRGGADVEERDHEQGANDRGNVAKADTDGDGVSDGLDDLEDEDADDDGDGVDDDLEDEDEEEDEDD